MKQTIDVTINFNWTFEYILPEIKDDENNPVYIDLQPSYINDFVKIYNNKKLIIYPTDWKYLTTHKVNITLTDKLNSTF